MRLKTILAAALAAALLPGTALAASLDFYGTWLIAEARVAPWAKAGESAFSLEEQHRLVGSKVIYRKTRIDGLAPLGCARPHYRVIEVPPDYLFQGTLTQPAAQAQALGFRSARIATLDTGCEGAIDFHFVDPTTAMFALNNMIYTLRRQ